MTAIDRMNDAVAFLKENGCTRHGVIWATPDGRLLQSDPIESARRLRRERLIKEIAERKESGRGFTR